MDKNRNIKILELLDKHKYLSVHSLSRHLECTEATVRRALELLDKEGLLKRVHGGAVNIGSNFVHCNVKEALYQNREAKISIARKAFELLEDGDSVFIDDASTCMYLSGFIENHSEIHLHIITNSVIFAERIFGCSHASIMLIGGSVSPILGATEGENALAQISTFTAKRAFIGVNGIDVEKGITLIGYPQQEVKAAMMKTSKENYILADSSKFGNVYMSKLCDLSFPTAIIADGDLPPSTKRAYQEKGIRIL